MTEALVRRSGQWPRLRLSDWPETRDTVHLWTQIIGKVRMAHAPMINHWWQATLYVTPRGLTTAAIPCASGAFDCEFDFVDHLLRIRSSDGGGRAITLARKPVAQFYAETMGALAELGLHTRIHARPNEVDPAIPFAEDDRHASYDSHAAELFWRQLLQANRLLDEFRAGFVGKVSPVHYFWGAMDLACTRFSGRPAPMHPGGAPNCPAWVMQEGYSHELASCGFWPGGGEEGAFYAYAYPEPSGYADAEISPAEAFYSRELGEFVLPYEAVAGAENPDRVLADFLGLTYAAGAELGGWPRATLETDPHRWDGQRVSPGA
ncbi:DUF5996 family protein [Geodermatophilus sp. URMC 63]